MNITIFGATGQVGRRVLDEAMLRGHQVTAVSRSAVAHVAVDSTSWETGDARVPDDVVRLSRGRDVVISATSGPRSGGDELAITADALLRGVTTTGARLIVAGGAGPLVVPGSDGRLVLDDPRFVPEPIRGVARACVDQLDALRRSSGVDWTYFSPSADLLPGERTERFRVARDELVVDSDGASTISFEDAAVAILDEVERPKHQRTVFTAGY
ncbi:NAD(P)-dependent oxidoreductase [Ilumatobacter coccineus]|uniref:NAD(P)-binding domain-containing protein n=1 Tax=Ilumatobacter coccineus (strain NBRC 103263 / KCTC 29153 / YM16-304) TaxID=1313172 RepID=A0A6C7E6L5_ILUCY|nr:NAD(P)H-binding protein [Ilumatobacter coccineus]BAN00889.1 hypothetical protein YM304_05750 [Ilumatobacter coccineus YM16-304]